MRLNGWHEPVGTCLLPHDELVQPQRFPMQSGGAVDLAGQGHDLARAAGRSPDGVLGCGGPVLSDHQSPVQAAAPTNDRDGGQPPEDGERGLGRAELQDAGPDRPAVRHPRRPTSVWQITVCRDAHNPDLINSHRSGGIPAVNPMDSFIFRLLTVGVDSTDCRAGAIHQAGFSRWILMLIHNIDIAH